MTALDPSDACPHLALTLHRFISLAALPPAEPSVGARCEDDRANQASADHGAPVVLIVVGGTEADRAERYGSQAKIGACIAPSDRALLRGGACLVRTGLEGSGATGRKREREGEDLLHDRLIVSRSEILGGAGAAAFCIGRRVHSNSLAFFDLFRRANRGEQISPTFAGGR